jgi:heme oxygenase
MIGVLYVWEGSRLGARVLLPLVKKSEDARESADSTRLIAGARYGFEVFQRAFQGTSGSTPLLSLGAA